MILVSGDGDYVPLLEYANSQGVKTEVVAFGKTGSSMLFEKADEVIDISDDPKKFLMKSTKIPFKSKNSSNSSSTYDKSKNHQSKE